MEFNYFDLIVAIIILLLGLKGVINGFFKELFGLVGIIGGIFVASRVGDDVGLYVSNLIFKFDNASAITFTGFLITLIVFWILMISMGALFKKLSAISGLGIFDKLLGFIFGSAKFFLIIAVITHALYNIKAIRETIDESMKTSFLFPIFVEAGSVIMKLDPIEITQEINTGIDKAKDTIETGLKEKTKETIETNLKEKTDQIHEEATKLIEESTSEEKQEDERN
jgi:membrane protein required for colicin V production